jgi:hypothetical protein
MVVDFATRYPEAVPLARIDTESIAEALHQKFLVTEVVNLQQT